MSDTLLILLPPMAVDQRPLNTQDLIAAALLLDENGRICGAIEHLSLAGIGRRYAAAEPGSREFVVLLAGEDVLLTRVTLPGQKQRQIRQALPFLVEEFIAEDPEDIHVVLGPSQPDGTNAAAVIRRDLLRFWMEALAKEDLYPDLVIPEPLFVPMSEGTVGSLVVDEGRCYLRTGPYSAMALERDTLRESLRICLPVASNKHKERNKLACWTSTGGSGDEQLIMELGQAIAPTQIRQMPFEQSHLRLFAESFSTMRESASQLNLLQDEFESDRRRSATRTMLVRVATLLLVVFFTQVVFDLGRTAWLRNQAASWDQEAEAVYRELFPQDRRLINLRTQMENHLARMRETGSANDFLALMGAAGKYSRSFRPNEFVIQRVNFSETNRSLMLDLHTASLQTLDRYKQALAQDGLQVDIASAVSEDSVVKARLRIGRINL